LNNPPDEPLPTTLSLPTPAGQFVLAPVDVDRDLELVSRWMNDPAVALYWELDGPRERTADHLAEQQRFAHSRPYLVHLDSRPIGYWEIYRAAEDRLAAYYEAEPGDLGVHLLIGEADCRGIGLGTLLLTAVCDALQVQVGGSGDGDGRRIVAEPDSRNVRSVRAFLAAGFRAAGTITLPEKSAVLVIREARA
jgi:acetyl CoA:N6-hydroxylysine acetyl transferase